MDNKLEVLILRTYYDLKPFFSKAASDKLLPHRLYDYKIKLEAEHQLLYSPLYKHTKEELQAAKKYITENLAKGFIAPS